MIFWSCKVESDNDRLKGEVLPKREELVETERRLSEKTNDLREVRKNSILFNFKWITKEMYCKSFDLLFYFCLLIFTGSRMLWNKQLISTPWTVPTTTLKVIKIDYSEFELIFISYIKWNNY